MFSDLVVATLTPLPNPVWEYFISTMENDRTAFEIGDFDLPLLKNLRDKQFLRSLMANSLFYACDDLHALDNLGVCGGVRVRSHASYCEDWKENGQL